MVAKNTGVAKSVRFIIYYLRFPFFFPCWSQWTWNHRVRNSSDVFMIFFCYCACYLSWCKKQNQTNYYRVFRYSRLPLDSILINFVFPVDWLHCAKGFCPQSDTIKTAKEKIGAENKNIRVQVLVYCWRFNNTSIFHSFLFFMFVTSADDQGT